MSNLDNKNLLVENIIDFFLFTVAKCQPYLKYKKMMIIKLILRSQEVKKLVFK